MDLSTWRKSKPLTLAEMAARLGIEDANPARTLQRYETGERRPTAELTERIAVLTGGEVSAQDMHATRLAWERANLDEGVSS